MFSTFGSSASFVKKDQRRKKNTERSDIPNVTAHLPQRCLGRRNGLKGRPVPGLEAECNRVCNFGNSSLLGVEPGGGFRSFQLLLLIFVLYRMAIASHSLPKNRVNAFFRLHVECLPVILCLPSARGTDINFERQPTKKPTDGPETLDRGGDEERKAIRCRP